MTRARVPLCVVCLGWVVLQSRHESMETWLLVIASKGTWCPQFRLGQSSSPALLLPLSPLVCLHTTCVPSFLPHLHFFSVLSFYLDNFLGLFVTLHKCHFIMKPFKTLCRLRLATLPSTSLSPWTSLNHTPLLWYYNCLSPSFHSYWVWTSMRAGVQLCPGTMFCAHQRVCTQ